MSKEAMTLALETLYEYVEQHGQTHLAKRAMPELRKALAKQEQGAPDELKHIDERDCLLDVDEKAWRSLIENRGGCRCHLSPPCGACANPISEEEMNEVGYTYTTPQPAQKPWVGLTWHDVPNEWVGNIAFMEGAKWAADKLKEKNSA